MQQYTQHDLSLLSGGMFLRLMNHGRTIDTKESIEFQFPPKFPSDSRSGTWEENDYRGTEPFATFVTSGPRVINMNWHYMIDGNFWTGAKIQENVLKLRGYFARIKNPGADKDNLVVQLKMWGLGGKDPISARIRSIDIKHGDTIIGAGDVAYPLRTDVSLDLRLWTKISNDGSGNVIDIPKLVNDLPQDWY